MQLTNNYIDPDEAMDNAIIEYKNNCIIEERERIGGGFLLLIDKYQKMSPDLIGDIRKLIFKSND